MGSLVLSKSGRAVLFYPGDGSVWITSVSYLRLLLDGKLRGNLLVLKPLSGALDLGIGSVKKGGKGGIRPSVGGEVLL